MADKKLDNRRRRAESDRGASRRSQSHKTIGRWPNLDELFYRKGSYEIKAPFSDAELERTERVLGVRLPKSYVRLLCERNGGGLRYNSILLKRAPKTFHMSGRVYSLDAIAGLHRSHSDGLTQHAEIGEEWGVPSGMIPFDGDGHWWICLDYRKCGPLGEPTIVHWDQPDPMTKKLDTFKVADSVHEFITHLQFDTPTYVFSLDSPNLDESGLAQRLEQLGCRKVTKPTPRWKWPEYRSDMYPDQPVDMFVTDNSRGENGSDSWHLARPAGQRLLLVGVSKKDQRECITATCRSIRPRC